MIANILGVVRARIQEELQYEKSLAAQALRMRLERHSSDAFALAQLRIEKTTHALTALANGRLSVVNAYLSRKSKLCFVHAGLFSCLGPTPESRTLLSEAKDWVRLRRLLTANRHTLRHA